MLSLLKSGYGLLFGKMSSVRFAGIWSLMFVVFYNTAFFGDAFEIIDFSRVLGIVFAISLALVLWLLTFFLLNLITLPYIGKPLFMGIAVAAASVSYFMNTYGVVIHKLMIQNTMETDAGEVSGLLSLNLIVQLILLGLVPAVLIWRTSITYFKPLAEAWRKIKTSAGALLLAIVIILALSADYASFFRNHKEVRQKANPLNFIVATISYFAENDTPVEVKPIATDARLGPRAANLTKPNLLIVVVGETARADHFSINGYDRETTPLIAQQNIINFTNVYSCGTETAVSVPCMFSLLDRKNYSDRKAKEQETVLDLIHRAGIPVLWRDNNSSCKGTCDRVAYEDMRKLKIPELCNERECFDDVLLYELDERLAAMAKSPAGKLILLHQKGSHGPDYFNRYKSSQEKFTPVCKTNQLQNCTQEEVINAFDNTIYATDAFLNNTIEQLKRLNANYNTALLYLSDHGESLGENKIYLHGMPYMIAPEAQKHVPFFLWFSDSFVQENAVNTECLAHMANDEFSQDYLFHTLLGLLNVETQVYAENLDMLSRCRTTP